MSYYITGTGTTTNPQGVVWFCHLCLSSFVLPYGCYHQCRPDTRPFGGSR